MTRFEIEAIRNLPEDYVLDGTIICEHREFVVAFNRDRKPIKYFNGEWSNLRFEAEPFNDPIRESR